MTSGLEMTSLPYGTGQETLFHCYSLAQFPTPHTLELKVEVVRKVFKEMNEHFLALEFLGHVM